MFLFPLPLELPYMQRNSRLVQLFGLAALGIALGVLALMIFGPPPTRSTEPPRKFSVPLEEESPVPPKQPAVNQ